MTRVLLICPDKTGPLMAGSAIRSVEVASMLARDFDVTLAVPDDSEPVASAARVVRVPRDSTLPALVDAADCVMIAGRSELMTAIRKPLVVDLYDPFILSDLEFYGEGFEDAGGRPLLALRWLQHHLENGDFFVCASEAQRRFWLGMLAAAGRLNHANYAADRELARLLAVVPFGITNAPPERTAPAVKGVIPGIDPDDAVVLWAGGLWNWFDPLTLVEALHRLRATRPEVKGLFLGVRHPNPDIGRMETAERALARARELDLVGRGAFFIDWVPYGERQNYLLDANVGVSLHRPGIEAQFAFRTRVLDYLWAGLPMVLGRDDDLADRIEREGLGLTVPYGDVERTADAITAMIDAPATPERAARFAALRAELSWARVVEPIREFCRAPRFAADKARGGAWVAEEAPRERIVHKEAALVAEEFLGPARELSPALGRYYAAEHRFVAAYDDLCRIDVLPRVIGDRPQADVVFSLWDEGPTPARVARVCVALWQIPQDQWQRFEFRPIPNSRGRSYRVTIEAPSTIGSGVALWLSTPVGADAPAPAMIVHYLVKGLVDALPITDESFLFLHNTTVSDVTVPGVAALASEEDVASSLVGADAAGGAPLRDDALRTALARATATLAATRREMAALGDRLADAERREAETPPRVRRIVRFMIRGGRAAKRRARRAAGFVAALGLALASVPLVLAVGAMFVATDARNRLGRGRRATAPLPRTDPAARPRRVGQPVSIVIPTWNGRELLEMSLPPLAAALARHAPGGEIVVVDNGSEDDTREWVAAHFPAVRVIALPTNEGFAGATNRGAQDSLHPTVILLNNDMVVEPDFILPLLAAMDEEPDVFGVSCQIDFIDKNKPRWETGKVHAEWTYGTIHLFHVDRWDDASLYPIFFAGGGASAYDRAKFLELGGFDEAVFSPVYIEDVELGYRAWKRGWPSLFAPGSRVHHRHRSTTRRRWSEDEIYSFFVKNLAALVWKNVDDPRMLARHLLGLLLLPLRLWRQANRRVALYTWRGMWRQLPVLARARLREGRVARALDDATIFHVARYRHAYRGALGRRPRRRADARPRVLIVSPYSPYPPVHGGAVRILALLRRLASVADVTLLAYADTQAELDPRSTAELQRICRDVVVIERDTTAVGGVLFPNKTRGFCSRLMRDEIEYWLDREDFDVIQIEYTHLAHLMPMPARGLLRVLVEHDVSFVSLARARATTESAAAKIAFAFDWMRMLRYELAAVSFADLVLTMSETDRDVLDGYVDTRHVVSVPNGVDCRAFPFAADGRDPASILFVGFFRHEPNVEAVRYFCREVLPRVRARLSHARFRVVGAYPPDVIRRLADDPAIEVTGRVDDIAAYYRSSAVFVAPVLQGSGTRLKILEAMASGCPVVSTTIGAEGLATRSGEELVLADDAASMADAIVRLLEHPEESAALARRARAHVEARFDWDIVAAGLARAYEAALAPVTDPALPAPPTALAEAR
ncbi:MAG: glycosyltransferase [Deltaproteobacteria bacterium]|nr:glycosyltransferase [Deltaproteobacteria bacterium]